MNADRRVDRGLAVTLGRQRLGPGDLAGSVRQQWWARASPVTVGGRVPGAARGHRHDPPCSSGLPTPRLQVLYRRYGIDLQVPGLLGLLVSQRLGGMGGESTGCVRCATALAQGSDATALMFNLHASVTGALILDHLHPRLRDGEPAARPGPGFTFYAALLRAAA